jgi:hypothetical protein
MGDPPSQVAILGRVARAAVRKALGCPASMADLEGNVPSRSRRASDVRTSGRKEPGRRGAAARSDVKP